MKICTPSTTSSTVSDNHDYAAATDRRLPTQSLLKLPQSTAVPTHHHTRTGHSALLLRRHTAVPSLLTFWLLDRMLHYYHHTLSTPCGLRDAFDARLTRQLSQRTYPYSCVILLRRIHSQFFQSYSSFTWHLNDFETWPGKRLRPYALSVNFLYWQI